MFPFFENISTADAQGKICNYNKRKMEVDCLREELDKTTFGSTVPKGKRGLGLYGCGQSNRIKHTDCLRELLGQHSTEPDSPTTEPTPSPKTVLLNKMEREKNGGVGYPDTCEFVYGNGGNKSLGTDHGLGERAVTNCIIHNDDYINTGHHPGGCGGLRRDQHFRTLAGLPINRSGVWNEDKSHCKYRR